MRIACLAWGSLVWKWEPLVLDGPWEADGPWLPIEFAREGDGGELATALAPGVRDVPTLWAPLATTNVDEARELLRRREKIPLDRPEGVGSVAADEAPSEPLARRIAAWAATQPVDAVVWTALPPRSRGIEGRMPSVDEACAYLASLAPAVRAHAEHYVRCVPASLGTPYRTAFEQRFGWTPLATPCTA